MINATPFILDRDAAFYVAGHSGLVGSAVCRNLIRNGFSNIKTRSSAQLDLRNRQDVYDFFRSERPRYVVLAAAKVGGILANSTFPVDFISDNLQIQTNVLDAAREYQVERLLFLGSSCIYPKFAPQPITEDALLTGHLEQTNDAYAIAKIAGIIHIQAVRRQYGLPWISAMPTNLYGPFDNFSVTGSHVIPALIRRYTDATREQTPIVANWGTGTPRREFMHVDDLANACLWLLENYDDPSHINVGTGSDVTIAEIAAIVSDISGYHGETVWDVSKPDGTPQKLMDVTRLSDAGWKAEIGLHEGLEQTVEWYLAHRLDDDTL